MPAASSCTRLVGVGSGHTAAWGNGRQAGRQVPGLAWGSACACACMQPLKEGRGVLAASTRLSTPLPLVCCLTPSAPLPLVCSPSLGR